MRITSVNRKEFDATTHDVPVIEGSAPELAKLAEAVMGAIIKREAVVMSRGSAIIGVRLVEAEYV